MINKIDNPEIIKQDNFYICPNCGLIFFTNNFCPICGSECKTISDRFFTKGNN